MNLLYAIRSHDGVVTLTMQRAERGNALGAQIVESLIEELQSAFDTPDVHTFVLEGAGEHFCTGLDLSDLEQVSDGDLLLRLVRIETLLSMVWHAPLRTVAVAKGRTWGAGADLFAACELRLVQPGASFRFPGAQFGIVLGTRRLAERVGVDAARRLVIEGLQWDAEQALAAGLANGAGPWSSAPPQVLDAESARAIRAATRGDARDSDLAALVRSASVPGLRARMQAYRARQLSARRA